MKVMPNKVKKLPTDELQTALATAERWRCLYCNSAYTAPVGVTNEITGPDRPKAADMAFRGKRQTRHCFKCNRDYSYTKGFGRTCSLDTNKEVTS